MILTPGELIFKVGQRCIMTRGDLGPRDHRRVYPLKRQSYLNL